MNRQIGAASSFYTIPVPRYRRLSVPGSKKLRYHSAYGQPMPLVLQEPTPIVQERFELIKLMRSGNKSQFQIQFKTQKVAAGVSQLQFLLFVNGKNFTSQQFIPDQLRDRDSSGKTCLHYAAAGGVDLLNISYKSRLIIPLIGIQDQSGISALMCAAYLGNQGNVAALQEELLLQDSKGRTALMYAIMGRKSDVAARLWKEEHNIPDYQGVTPTEYCIKYGIQERVEAILKGEVRRKNAYEGGRYTMLDYKQQMAFLGD